MQLGITVLIWSACISYIIGVMSFIGIAIYMFVTRKRFSDENLKRRHAANLDMPSNMHHQSTKGTSQQG